MPERHHPDLAKLIREPLLDETREHLAHCLECQVHVRIMRLDAAPLPSSSGSPVTQMERDWGSVAQRFRENAPPRFEIPTPLQWKQNRGDAAVVVAVDATTRSRVDLGLVIRPGPAGDPGQLAALEAQELPSVAPILQTISHNGEVFFLTDLQGPTLSLAEDDVTVTPQLGVRELVLALRALHARGIVHGDISAQSVRITPGEHGANALVLGPPCAHPGGADARADWRQLGDALLTVVEPDDTVLTDFLEGLGRVQDQSDEAVLAELLEITVGNHDGRHYRAVDHLGTGGTGMVHRAFDRVLGREVAYKVVREDRRTVADVARWRADAQFMARLPHPGIPQVHEFGTQPDGRPYYTMQVLGEGTLEDKIREVHRHGPSLGEPADGGWTLRRLVQALLSATEAVAFAHARSIVHRDLKPANILVGDFGFVQVGDWGHAIDLEEPTAPGTVSRGPLGTRGYMPPEQDRRDPVSHRPGDVFSLGATLHHVLHGARPGGAERALPPAEALLGEIAEQCMHREVARRPQTAASVAEDLRTWLDGSMARDRARKRMSSVSERWKEVQALRAIAATEQDQARQMLAALDDYAPMESKLEGWRLQDMATEREQKAERLQVEVVGQLQSILRDAPGLQQAEDLLTDHYRECLRRADAAADPLEIERFERLLQQRPGLQHSSFVKGIGYVSLFTDPPGAHVVAKRFVEVDRRLVLREEHRLGVTPLREVALPMGSWMLLVHAPGHEPMRYPVYLGRGDHWDGVPPSESEPYPVPLLRDGALGDDECYVPAGWFRCGGNTEISGGFSERRLWCGGFVMQRHAPTHDQYLAFLNRMVDERGPVEAAPFVPQKTGRGAYQPEYQPSEWGEYRLVPRVADSVWQSGWPVTAMDWPSACAFAATHGPPGAGWRLPHEFEWEKAARGVDGRCFPWGNRGDPAFTNMQTSQPRPIPVKAHEVVQDVSPYGIVGLGGNTSSWCNNRPEDALSLQSGSRVGHARDTDPVAPSLAVRGGTFASEMRNCQTMTRLVLARAAVSIRVGIRLVRDVASRPGLS